MNRILLRFCAAALSVIFFCSSGVFAMFDVGQELRFPPVSLRYNDILVARGYPYVIKATDIEKMNPDVKKHWCKFWWAYEAMRYKRVDFDTYIKTSRAYSLTAEIQIRKRNTETGRSEKWERVNSAFKSAGEWVFHAFLADYFYDFYKRDCHKRFTTECLWSMLNEINSTFVRKRISEKTGEELSKSEDICEKFKEIPIDEKDIDDCFLSIQDLPTPVYPYTQEILSGVQFVGEGLYYMKFDSLVIFFSTLYAYFFDMRTKYCPEQLYIIHSCLENLYFGLVTDVLEEHKKERSEWFFSSQYCQLLELRKICNPDSTVFQSREKDVMSKLKFLGLEK